MRNNSLHVPPSCRFALRLLWGGRADLWARLVVGFHLRSCASCRHEKAAWESLEPMLAGWEERPGPTVRAEVLRVSRRMPRPVIRPLKAWKLALAGPALVAVSFLVCVLTKERPDVGWDGGFAQDLAAVRFRVAALNRSVESSSTTWDGRVQRIRGKIDVIESAVEQETWSKETEL